MPDRGEFLGAPEDIAQNSVTILPKEIYESELAEARPNYVVNIQLNKIITALTAAGVFKFPENCWQKLSRIEGLDEIQFTNRGSGEVTPKLGEIADANFQELERATTAKWQFALNYFFHLPEIQKIPVHGADKRIKIAIPGCSLGFEIGGLLDFFNSHNLSVDIEAVDNIKAGAESRFTRLDERTKQNGSTVVYHSETDANEFFEVEQQDIVIFRHPGSFYYPESATQWHKIFDSMMKTDPAVIIVSTFDYEVSAETSAQELGSENKAVESDLIKKWLEEGGYTIPESAYATLKDDTLEVPLNPYMYSDKKGEENQNPTEIFDRHMFVAIKKS